ncbi:MAG: aminotransferase class V-fold PLP-dependent enzyme [Erythrobacter sp.]|nr:aminotransferase class V-fold PLP-dependent enzyme [Erythrobacter sp.]
MSAIGCQRDRFTIPRDVHYLNCAYMAPLTRDVVTAMEQAVRLKATPWTFTPPDFFDVCEEFRDRAGRLIGTAAENCAIVPSVSYALAVASKNLPFRPGQEVLTLAEQFPSNVYAWRKLAQERQGRVVAVQRDQADSWTPAVLDAIGPDTAIVAVPHCHWADGRVVDLEEVGKKCRENGAALVLDLTQSLGAMPIDFATVQPDFAVAASYKWMMGPYGVGVLYVDPKHHNGEPLEQNWINRAGSQDFARLVDYRDEFQLGARRFDMGEKSNPPMLKGASAGIDFLLEYGVEAIAKTLRDQTTRIAEAAKKIGLSSAPIGVRAAHFLSLDLPSERVEGLAEKLAAQNVFVSVRGSSLRVTPHLYNDEEDAQALLNALI